MKGCYEKLKKFDEKKKECMSKIRNEGAKEEICEQKKEWMSK
jgi:hypothetical protein